MASPCSCFDFSSNGRHISTGNYNGDLAILDVRTGKAVKSWNVHGVDRVLFSTSDGNKLLCSYRGVIEHWDLNEAEPLLIWTSVAKVAHEIAAKVCYVSFENLVHLFIYVFRTICILFLQITDFSSVQTNYGLSITANVNGHWKGTPDLFFPSNSAPLGRIWQWPTGTALFRFGSMLGCS